MFKYNKIRELVYVLMRIGLAMRHEQLSGRLQTASLLLLEEIARSDFKNATKSAAALAELLVLGRELYEIDPVHADYLLNEISYINSAIRQSSGFAALPDQLPDIEKIFKIKQGKPDELKDEASDSLHSAIRQSAIADKIREFSGSLCQMKDLLTAFPTVSERTLRYDLQKLINQGTIERIGFGPGSSYKIRTPETTRV